MNRILTGLLFGGAGIAMVAGIAAVVVWQVSDRLGNRYRVEGSAMAPNFCAGDMVRFDDFDGTFDRWQVIIFEYPGDRSRLFIKRVAGLPGETIEVKGGQIFIDGSPVEGDTYGLTTPNYEVPPLTIPPNRYFVLGDNRRNSFDSHAWGNNATESGRAEASTVPDDYIKGELSASAHGCSMSGSARATLAKPR